MRRSPGNRDKTCEIAHGPFFYAEVPRRFGPILATPGALSEPPRGKSNYNLIGPRPGARIGSQLCYQQHKGLFIYNWVAWMSAGRPPQRESFQTRRYHEIQHAPPEYVHEAPLSSELPSYPVYTVSGRRNCSTPRSSI